MKRLAATGLVVVALVAASCGARGDQLGVDDEGGVTTTVPAGGGSGGETKFGSIDSPCGPAPDGVTVSIKADEAGRGTDKLYLGVANERVNQIPSTQGLLKEMWDSSVAFAAWCNEQGGIAGKQIELVDLDGHVLEVEKAMSLACTDVFAMVGGGYAQDQLIFSGKDGADFHKCRMISFPGFAVSVDFAEANGVIQVLPNRAYLQPDVFIRDLVALYPEEMKQVAAVWGNLDSIRVRNEQTIATGKFVKGFGLVGNISYDVIGQPDWNLVAQQVKDTGAKAIAFTGQPANMALMMKALRDQNWRGPVFAESNQYDELLLATVGPEAVEGALVRVGYHPFEEKDRWPATKQYLDIMGKYGPADAKVALLGAQSFSSWLLFATAVNDCVKSGGGEISRDCVMAAGKQINEWDGGGLHVKGDPGAGDPSPCAMIMIVKDGRFERRYPPLGGDGDDGDGFSCGKVAEITGDLGQGNVDPTRKY